LLAADIRVWILTGDKRETAVNIAQSSGLCSKSTRLLILDRSGLEAVIAKLREFNDSVITFIERCLFVYSEYYGIRRE
jgi:magnesium-transporting ATPase (P-type)